MAFLESKQTPLFMGCPQCGGSRDFPPQLDGQTVRCANCNAEVVFGYTARAEIAIAWNVLSMDAYLRKRQAPSDYDEPGR
jgi:uncharacterized paraquat-inducible protein A